MIPLSAFLATVVAAIKVLHWNGSTALGVGMAVCLGLVAARTYFAARCRGANMVSPSTVVPALRATTVITESICHSQPASDL